jgi:DNA primase
MSDNSRVDFNAIKARADFRAVLAHYDLPAGKGSQFKIRCPFHEDGEPSCSINTEQQVFHCFGSSCGAQGGVLDFVHRMEAREGAAVSIRQSAITLAEICAIPIAEVSAAGKRSGGRTERRGKRVAG